MKDWIGPWLMGVAGIHTAFAFFMFGDVILDIVDRGVFDSVGNDPLIGAVTWFLLFGLLLFACGQTVARLEKATHGQLPKPIGWSLLGLAILGVVLMPVSGFWLAFPPAIAVLIRRDW